MTASGRKTSCLKTVAKEAKDDMCTYPSQKKKAHESMKVVQLRITRLFHAESSFVAASITAVCIAVTSDAKMEKASTSTCSRGYATACAWAPGAARSGHAAIGALALPAAAAYIGMATAAIAVPFSAAGSGAAGAGSAAPEEGCTGRRRAAPELRSPQCCQRTRRMVTWIMLCGRPAASQPRARGRAPRRARSLLGRARTCGMDWKAMVRYFMVA